MAEASGRQRAATRRALEDSRLYSEGLGIALDQRCDREYFRWFLASALFGARISETIAISTFRAFDAHGLTTPEKILGAGKHVLVSTVMREGGYVRYDGRKSDQILRNCAQLLDEYEGRLSRLHAEARDNADLEARLDAFYGVGPTTTNIFLRELRPYWPKADPAPLPIVLKAAEAAGLDLDDYDRKTLTFARVEAGLIRFCHQGHFRTAREIC